MAIERVEILRGGASAIYGSDAVAGVINIITRKNFDGARLELDGQTTTRFDQRDGTASVALGAASKRGRVFIAGSYFNRSELVANQRDWTKDGYISSEGLPGHVHPGYQDRSRTLPATACLGRRSSRAPPVRSARFNTATSYSLVPEASRANMFGSGEYDITKHTTAFGEILASQLRGGYISSPAFPIPPPFLTVPANHVDNPFGQPVLAIIRPRGRRAGGSRAETDDDTLRGVIGLKGDFEGVAAGTPFESWTWEPYATAANDRSEFILPDTLRGAIQNALNSCSESGQSLRIATIRSTPSINGTGTPNSTALINSFYGAQDSITDSQMQTVNAGMSGTLFDLPGGELGGRLRQRTTPRIARDPARSRQPTRTPIRS